jgi:hypothetical protein
MSWENNEIQFARLLCELVASDYNVTDAAKSMDLEVKDINELLDRAHTVWERAKIEGSLTPYEMDAKEGDTRYWLGLPHGLDVGVLHNDDGINVAFWANSNEDSARADVWLTWDELMSAEELGLSVSEKEEEKE